MLSHFSCVRLFMTPWTEAHQALDSPGKNAGVACHAFLQGIFPTQGLDLRLVSPALAGGFFTTSTTFLPSFSPSPFLPPMRILIHTPILQHTHTFTCPFIFLFIHPPTHPSIYSPIHSSIPPSIHPPTHPLIYLPPFHSSGLSRRWN